MLDPISARLASSCSKKGIKDAEIEAIKQSEEALAVAKRAETASASRTQAGNGQNRNDPILNNQESATDKDSDEASILAGGAEDVRLQTASSDSSQSPNYSTITDTQTPNWEEVA